MHDQKAALILAKAGLDRLLQAEQEGFLNQSTSVRAQVRDCRFQILPVSLNPPAPAQGALAIEVARANETLNAMCRQLSEEAVFACVAQEREILRRYGGGCHQKIGVAVLPRPYGTIHALRGLTDGGEVLCEWRLENATAWTRAVGGTRVFPLEPQQNSWFERHAMPLNIDLNSKFGLFIARAEALPEGNLPSATQLVWTAGVQTWKRLARQGVWVSGCQDGLGEQEPFALEPLLEKPVEWLKLTHLTAAGPGAMATYQLTVKEKSPDLRGKTHFYWMSRTSFERAFALYPKEIAAGYNACGPGVTYDFLQRQTGLQHEIKVFIGLEQFLRETLP